MRKRCPRRRAEGGAAGRRQARRGALPRVGPGGAWHGEARSVWIMRNIISRWASSAAMASSPPAPLPRALSCRASAKPSPPSRSARSARLSAARAARAAGQGKGGASETRTAPANARARAARHPPAFRRGSDARCPPARLSILPPPIGTLARRFVISNHVTN